MNALLMALALVAGKLDDPAATAGKLDDVGGFEPQATGTRMPFRLDRPHGSLRDPGHAERDEAEHAEHAGPLDRLPGLERAAVPDRYRMTDKDGRSWSHGDAAYLRRFIRDRDAGWRRWKLTTSDGKVWTDDDKAFLEGWAERRELGLDVARSLSLRRTTALSAGDDAPSPTAPAVGAPPQTSVTARGAVGASSCYSASSAAPAGTSCYSTPAASVVSSSAYASPAFAPVASYAPVASSAPAAVFSAAPSWTLGSPSLMASPFGAAGGSVCVGGSCSLPSSAGFLGFGRLFGR